ncbi:hypothetical protein Tco_0175499 [Tanacetum coccineum]
MAQLKYCDKHNQVGFLRKPDESAGFAEIVDFLRGSNLRYALTTNPTIHDSLVKQFWQTATAKTLADGTLELHATIDTIAYTITEASIRSKLKLADASGITMLPNNEIFEGMGHMGYPTDGSFTFWKSFFTPQWRFLVHHILHCISSKSGGWDQFGSNIATALICLSTGRVYNFSKLIFDGMVANLKSKTKFLMYPRFLQLILDIQTENKHPYLAVTLTKKIFGNMKRGFRGVPRPLLPAMLSIANPSAGQEAPSVTQSQPSSSVVPPTPPTTQPISSEATTIPPLSQPAPPTPIAETTNASPSPTPSPAHEPIEHTFEQPSSDQQPSTPRQEATTSQLMTRIDDLENQLKETKQTFGKAILKDFGGCFEEKDQEDSFLVTPSKTPSKNVNASGEEQVKDISPTTLEDAAILKVKSAFEKVNTGGIRVLVPSPNREEAGLAEAIRLDALEKALEKEEVAKQVHLDSLIAQRMAEEQELTEEQKKRKAQESVLGKDLTVEDYAKRMVELVNQRRKHFAEERARAKRNKHMTQTQLRNYMSNFLKNQGTWKLTQLKKLNFEEVKAEFEKLVKKLDTYVPMNFEATKESLKGFGEELQTKTAKKLSLMLKMKLMKDDTTQSNADRTYQEMILQSYTGLSCKKFVWNEPEENLKKSADIYMLIERKYPLSAEVCKAMLDKKLQGGKPDEDCYKLLKMMEKQAGAKGLTSPEQTATVEMVFSQPWTCTFLVAKGLTTPELMANWCKPTGRIFKTVGLRWIPTGKLFASSTTKVDSEPPHSSNVDITNLHECIQTLDINAGTLNLDTGDSQLIKKTAMAPVDNTSGLAPQRKMTSDYLCSELGFKEKKRVRLIPAHVAPRPANLTGTPLSTSIEEDAPAAKPSSQESSSIMQPTNPPFEHISKWTMIHPLENMISNPSRPVSTRKQLQTDAMWCFFDAFLTSVELKNFKETLLESS